MPLLTPIWGQRPHGVLEQFNLGLARMSRWARDFGLPLRPRCRLVYHPCYLDFVKAVGGRHSFDVKRPARILEQLQRIGIVSRDQIVAPERIRRDQLALVHDARYLDVLSNAQHLASLLHLPPDTTRASDNLLAPFLWQTGGTLLAARRALAEKVPVVNLGGGFHHAQRDRAEGFCPLNDIAVAIMALRQQGAVGRVLVVDLDYHQGTGTASIFAQDEAVFTLSLHGQGRQEPCFEKVNHLDVLVPPDSGSTLR